MGGNRGRHQKVGPRGFGVPPGGTPPAPLSPPAGGRGGGGGPGVLRLRRGVILPATLTPPAARRAEERDEGAGPTAPGRGGDEPGRLAHRDEPGRTGHQPRDKDDLRCPLV